MPVILIRHAHAGSRSAWEGDDALRPLSKKGRAQAQHLADRLGDEKIGHVLSSPMLRCVQTAEPIAQSRGSAVEVNDDLTEGADPDHAMELLMALAGSNPAMVGHGDLIPRLLGRFMAAGMQASGLDRCQKGSLWIVELDGDRPLRATYEPPLSAAKI